MVLKMNTNQLIEYFKKRDGITTFKSFECVIPYQGLEIGDKVTQGYNIEGRLLYFGKIKNSPHESEMFFNTQIENSENFRECSETIT
jgi:hypothetical protein